MTTIIDILASGRDNAKRWLAENKTDDGYADISDSNWETSLAVIDGIELDKVRLCDRTIFPNFVNSKITRSEFRSLTTDGHFWGGGNEWNGCSFSTSILQSVISPQNLFVDCTFQDIVFEGYIACETLFESCRFLNCKFDSLRTKPRRSSRWTISRMANHGSSLQFVGCEFVQTTFLHCVFADAAFQNNRLTDSIAIECDFTGVNSDCPWWSESAQSDLFVSYLDQVLAGMALQLGSNSSAVKALTHYRMEYVAGDNKSKDYSACLYGGDVPDRELDAAEEIIDRLGARFGF